MTPRGALAALISVVLAAGVLAVIVGDDDAAPGPEQARLRVEGEASVTGADGATRTVADATEVVDFGDQVVMKAGTGVLELTGGGTYELRHRDGTGSALEVGSPPGSPPARCWSWTASRPRWPSTPRR